MDAKDLSKSLAKECLKMALLKKGFFSSSEVSKAVLPLSPFAKNCSIKQMVAFPYKNNTKLEIEVSIKINKNLGKEGGMVVLTFDRVYPPFHDPSFESEVRPQ